MIRQTFIVLFLLLHFSGACRAKEAIEQRWSDEVVAEVFLEDMTPQQAERVCIARAKAKAVEQVAGVKVLSETLVKDSMVAADLVNAQSYAWVKETKDVKWEHETIPSKAEEPPKILWRVRLKALVALDGNQDDGFSLKVDLNRLSYQTGDEMQIRVRSGQDAYLTIFNVLEDGRVTVLLPNLYRMDRWTKKGTVCRFPDYVETIGSARKLKLWLPAGVSLTREAILVVATKDDIDLIETDFAEAGYAAYSRQTGLFRDVMEKLMNIPPSQRSIAVTYYEIRAKKP